MILYLHSEYQEKSGESQSIWAKKSKLSHIIFTLIKLTVILLVLKIYFHMNQSDFKNISRFLKLYLRMYEKKIRRYGKHYHSITVWGILFKIWHNIFKTGFPCYVKFSSSYPNKFLINKPWKSSMAVLDHHGYRLSGQQHI